MFATSPSRFSFRSLPLFALQLPFFLFLLPQPQTNRARDVYALRENNRRRNLHPKPLVKIHADDNLATRHEAHHKIGDRCVLRRRERRRRPADGPQNRDQFGQQRQLLKRIHVIRVRERAGAQHVRNASRHNRRKRKRKDGYCSVCIVRER
jgi:hypothetical protein